jgi:hypothetical protein
MKKIALTLLASFVFSLSFAQVFNTEHGKSFTKESEKDIYKIVFPSAYGFMTLHHLDNVMMDNMKTMVLTRHDQSMQSIETKEFNLPKLGNRASDLQEVIEYDDRLIFLSQVMQKSEAKHQVNAQVFTQENMTVSENKVLSSLPFEKYSRSGYYQIAVSPDKSKIAILANMPYEKKSQEVVKIWVYDNQLKLLWEQTEKLQYDSEKAYQEDTFVNNSGDVILSKTTDAYKKTRKTELITFNGTTSTKNTFSQEGFIPLEMAQIDVNGKPMLTGFYWDGMNSVLKINAEEGDDTNGAFLYDLGENKLIGFHKWNDDLKNPNDYKSLKVVDAKVINNDIYLIGEKQLQKSEFRKTGNTMSTEMDYFYTNGPSLIVNFDLNGTLKGFSPLFNKAEFKNYDKEKGSLSALYLENGLRVFSNNNGNKISLHSFFTDRESTFNPPTVLPSPGSSSQIPFLLPSTVRTVYKYGIVYYITNYGDKYWLNKMTW